MAQFNVTDFIANTELTHEDVVKLTSKHLRELCNHYDLTLPASVNKATLVNAVIAKLVDEGVMRSENRGDIDNPGASSGTDIPQLSSQQLFELEKMKLELNEKRAIKELELQMQKEEKESENQLQIKEHEMRIKEQELEIKRIELDRQFDLENPRSRESRRTDRFSGENAPSIFNVYNAQKCAPKFDDSDLDKYFNNFEKTAQMLDWPEEYWTIILQSQLCGKAAEAYSCLTIAQSKDFRVVKRAILNAYALLPEAYRQKFRNLRKNYKDNYADYSRNLQNSFEQWLRSCSVAKFDKLKELILVEQFVETCPFEVRKYLLDKDIFTLEECATWADMFELNHKHTKPANSNKNQNFSGGSKAKDTKPAENTTSDKPSTKNASLSCAYCKKTGHILADCLKLKAKKEREGNKSDNFSVAPHNLLQNIQNLEPQNAAKNELSPEQMSEIHPGLRFYVGKGDVSIPEDNVTYPVVVFRDSGAVPSLLKTGVIPPDKLNVISDECVLVKSLYSDVVAVPVAMVHIETSYGSWDYPVGLTDEMPDGITFILGNDVVHNLPSPVMSNTPVQSAETETVVQEFPDVFPENMITRSQSKKEDLANEQALPLASDDDSINLANSFFVSLNSSNENEAVSLTKSDLVAKQHGDPTLEYIYRQVVDLAQVDNTPVCFFEKNGVLMRKWRSPYDRADDASVKYQIVLPESYRIGVLKLAHEGSMSGHLGVRKTKDRILQHFFFPRLGPCVSAFCRTCHTCQLVGKPNQTIPKAHLKPIPVLDEPFSRILIDIVGPLPRTKKGNKYLLTIMDLTTRYPEAFPIADITAATVAENLIRFFSTFGFPKELQSDCGTNFMSELMQVLLHKLGIKQLKSTPYHPESQGVLERYHQNLKTMMKSYCLEHKEDWDFGIPLLLFATREVPVTSLGFSPFELIFGHEVRGILKLVKETMLDETNEFLVSNLLDYWTNIREKLMRSLELAHENLSEAQSKMKVWYDKRAVQRAFKPNDKVLVLLPVQGKPLAAKFTGPYKVIKKVNDLNYLVETPDRRRKQRLCHINMLKPYHTRPQTIATVVNVQSENQASEASDSFDLISDSHSPDYCDVTFTNSQFLEKLDSKLPSTLSAEQASEFKQLLLSFSGVFVDVPTVTTLTEHDIDVGTSKPVKQHPYRVHPEKMKLMRQEIETLEKSGIISKSNSPWSNPVISIAKPDGTIRLCADMRKVNRLSVTDSYPLPRVDDLVDRIGQSSYLTKWDLRKGFWQVPLTERAKKICAIATPFGLYEFNVMAFGLKNAPATFQRLMNMVLEGLDSFAVCFIDDICVYSNSWLDCLKYNQIVLERIQQANLTVNLEKSDFCRAQITYLGYQVGSGKVLPKDSNVRDILAFPTPTCKKTVRQLLGAVGYYRKFIRNFAQITAPLTDLLKKNVSFVWSPACDDAFQKLKMILTNPPVLLAPDFSREFIVAVDCSDIGMGSVLLQQDDSGLERPVSYFSKKLSPAQRKYSTIEKECLALVTSLHHYYVYLSVGTVKVYTDHNPLVFLNKMKGSNSRLLRWSLLIQSFSLIIVHIKGIENKIPDLLSRNPPEF